MFSPTPSIFSLIIDRNLMQVGFEHQISGPLQRDFTTV